MSFLTPLYLLGALAVSLPIVFHMIRRTPRGRTEFSSVMFLTASPPKITRRSRIEHWLLLLLRALAVCLLALAFARPFFRQSELLSLEDSDGRALVILIDTSASMRRDGLWRIATGKIDALLREQVRPADRVAVLEFADDVRTILGFEQWAALDPPRRAEAVSAALAKIEPGWGATDLASALIEAAEQLDSLSAQDEVGQQRKITLVSDLQSGSRLESLQSFEWPRGVLVQLMPVGDEAAPNNAGVHLVADSAVELETGAERTRVRVSNAEGADRDEFQLRWADEFDTPARISADEPVSADESVAVIVPAGQSRIVRAGTRPEGPGVGRLVLDGDEHEFDNVCWVPPTRPRKAVVAVLSGELAGDPQSLRFFLPAALSSLPQREIELKDWANASTGTASTALQLVIVADPPPDARLQSLQNYVRDGGTVLFAATSPERLQRVFELLDAPPAAVTDADTDDYAMLTRIDYGHPLFTALDDPRFSDFTKIRFWRHRVFPVDALPDADVIAWFDNGDPAVVESRLGKGRVIVMTSGWQPSDSQLAVSSKFVPMLNGLTDRLAGIVQRRTSYVVGEAVALSEFDLAADDVAAVQSPAGERLALAESGTSFRGTSTPGVYRFLLNDTSTGGGDAAAFAVNLDPAESRTSRLADDALAAAGVRLSEDDAAILVDAAAQRQLRAGELENRQKLWRWLVVALMVLLMVETLLASRAARRQLASS